MKISMAGQKARHSKRQSKYSFNDMLLPILAVLCIMPFVVHLKEYDYGYSEYMWHSADSTTQDIYSYYRSIFFLVVCGFALILLLFRIAIYTDLTKRMKIFIPLSVYAVLTIASSMLSINVDASLKCNFYQFQSLFVLLGYILMCIYTYQIMEKDSDYKSIVHGLCIMFFLISIVGFFQIIGRDLLNYKWIQKLIMSRTQYEIYGGQIEDVYTGNNVYLTLFSSNYAGVFLTMMSAVFGVLAYYTKNRQRVMNIVLFAISIILTWFTYSRSALAALAIGAIVFVVINIGRKHKREMLYGFAGICAIFIVCIIVDGTMGFKFISRMIDAKASSGISDMSTGTDGVSITFNDSTYVISTDNGNVKVMRDDTVISCDKKSPDSNEYILPFGKDALCSVINYDDMEMINLNVEDYNFEFANEDGVWYYYNEGGKLDSIDKVSHIDCNGLEYLGSGRVYIWSRTIPLLKKHLLIGSGPDTFAEVFPQDDYVGKYLYAGTTRRIMENAHNDILNHSVQEGVLATICLMIFVILIIIRGFKHFCKCDMTNYSNQAGAACYIAVICYVTGSMFNAGTLYTTPFAWVFIGIILSVVNKKVIE